MSSLTSRAALRTALVAAAIAALVVLLNAFSAGFRVLCLGVIVIATVLSFPESRREDGGWWWFLAGGAAGSVIGAIVAQPSATLGGWMALLGGLVVIIGATVGFPREEEE
jgi:hypothetical protein